MAAYLGYMLRCLHRLAGPPGDADRSDGQLLERFRAGRDEAAFAALVERHGPMVLAACRRLLPRAEDAEDAFQATFFVLARKAAAIRAGDSVGAWLYGVACRVARRARGQETGRRERERRATAMTRAEPVDRLTVQELRAVLDEELGALPEKYRAPLVLCYLQGKTQEQAAHELGCPRTSLASRLGRARELLRQRLARRGLSLTAGLLAGALAAAAAPAAVPAPLLIAAVRAGTGAASGLVSPRAITLGKEALRATAASRAQLLVGFALGLGLAFAGAGLLRPRSSIATSPGPADAEAPAPAPAAGQRVDRLGDPLPDGAVARLGTVRFRHAQWVTSVAFAPDGALVASASSDHTVRLWDPASGCEVRRLTGHRDAVGFVAFTADGKQLISAGAADAIRDTSIRLWDVATGREVGRLPPGEEGQPMSALTLSADRKTLAAGREKLIRLVEVPGGRDLGGCRLPTGQVKRLRFSPDGKRLVAAVEPAGVCLFDLGTRQLVWHNTDQPTDSLYASVAFAPDGRTVAAATGVRKPLRLLDAATGKEVRRLEGEYAAAGPLVFSRDGTRIFSGSWGAGDNIWNVATGKPTGALDPALGSHLALALSPDGKILAEASDRTLRFWDAATGKGIPGPEGAQALVSALAVAPDGKAVLTAAHFDAEDGARVWDLGTGRQRATLAGHRCPVAAFAPDGKTFAAGCFEGAPVLADAATGKKLRTFAGTPGWIDALVFTPDGRRLIGTGWINRPIRVWDTATGKELPPLGRLPQGGGARCLALAPGGKLLATGGMDRVIRLWDVAAGKEVRQLTGQEGSIWALAFSPDGREVAAVTATGTFNFIANGTDPAIRVWDVATGRLRRTLPGPAEGSWSVAWSPDGRVLATGGEDGVIRLWEVLSGQERARLTGHEGPVSALAFTPDGTRLVSGGSDTTVLVWDLAAPGRPARPPTADQLPGLLTDLADDDAARAFRAVAALAAAPGTAVPLLKERLRPVAAPEPGRLARLVADLDDDQFSVRDRANRELESLGELAAPALESALRKKPSAELRRRAEPLLERLAELPREQWPGLRAVEVLERAGTPEARRLLEALAWGAPEARLTREAKASVERLVRWPPPGR